MLISDLLSHVSWPCISPQRLFHEGWELRYQRWRQGFLYNPVEDCVTTVPSDNTNVRLKSVTAYRQAEN